MIKISNELLSEVLGETRVILDYEVSIDNTEIHWGHKDISEDGFINIFELAFRCKEWALNKNFTLLSSMEIDCGYCNISFILNNEVKYNLITGISEVEAIFKACEWILKEIKK